GAPGSSASHRTAGATTAAQDMDRMVDPVTHATFLTALHQATIVSEETGRLLQKIVAEAIEPGPKELSSALVHPHGPRSELDACVTKFEAALNRMRTVRQGMQGTINKLEEVGERFPTH